MEWVIGDLTKNEVQQSWGNGVLRIQRIPLQGFSTVPAKSVLAGFCNDRVDPPSTRRKKSLENPLVFFISEKGSSESFSGAGR